MDLTERGTRLAIQKYQDVRGCDRFRISGLLHRRIPGSRPLPVLSLSALQVPGDASLFPSVCWPSPGTRRRWPSTNTPRFPRVSRSRARSLGCRSGRDGDDVTELIEQHRVSGADGRTHHFAGSTAAHPYPRPVEQAHHSQAAERERRLHVGSWQTSSSTNSSGRGECEFLENYAKPFSLLVIADLLGVPTEDHDEFREVLRKGHSSVPWATSRQFTQSPAVAERQVLQPYRGPQA